MRVEPRAHRAARRLAGAVLFAVVCSGLSTACASILGFEDDVLRPDGGPDATGHPPPSEAGGDARGDARGERAPDAPADACGSVEICDNGVDDDCNGEVDCADPACTAGYACVPSAAGSGFTGPIAFWEGAASATPPACGGAFPDDVYDGNATPTQPPDDCSACSCTPPSAPPCGASLATFFADPSCTTPCGDAGTGSVLLPVGACVDVGALTGGCATPHVSLGAPAFTDAGCAPAGGVATPTAWTWTRQARACGTASPTVAGGCDAGTVCAPRPPFGPRACFLAAGTPSCPKGLPDRSVYYGAFSDERACTPCSCGPLDATCTGTVIEGGNPACKKSPGTVPAPSACVPVPSGVSHEKLGSVAATGSCPADGGTPTGSVVPGNPTTVCCAP